jgi:hypothetical protein
VGIDALGDACSLGEVLEQLLDSRRREGAIITAWSTLEANEDAIAGDFAGSSPVDVLLGPAREARNGDEPLTGLAPHSQIEVAIPIDEIAGGEVHQLADADACVAKDADDQLVALGHGDIFERLDLLSAEHLKKALGGLWELRLARYWFAFGLSPSEEDVDRRR